MQRRPGASTMTIAAARVGLTPRILVMALNAEAARRESADVRGRVDLKSLPIPDLSAADADRLDFLLRELERARAEAADYLSAITDVMKGLAAVVTQEQRPSTWI